jgi:hypothetical protein
MVAGMLDKDDLDHIAHTFQHELVQQLGAGPFDSFAFPICQFPPEEKARMHPCTQKNVIVFVKNHIVRQKENKNRELT